MSYRRVEVLVRAGEVVVVLDSVAELRAVFDRMPGEAVEARPEPPKPAAGSRVEAAGAQVCVPVRELWVMRSLLSEAEGMLRGMQAGEAVGRRDVHRWLMDVDGVRREWALFPAGVVSSQAGES